VLKTAIYLLRYTRTTSEKMSVEAAPLLGASRGRDAEAADADQENHGRQGDGGWWAGRRPLVVIGISAAAVVLIVGGLIAFILVKNKDSYATATDAQN
ncbi:unnamed protein product, partial [Amoebophrya sp. A25]